MAFVGIVGYTSGSCGVFHTIVVRVVYIFSFIIVPIVYSYLWCCKCRHVVILKLHIYIDDFIVRISFDQGDIVDGDLRHDLVDHILPVFYHACLSARCGV